jgi:hypothetical protein
MFCKRHQQIDALTSSIFDCIEKAKRKRQAKLVSKLERSIEKQLQEHCFKIATPLV